MKARLADARRRLDDARIAVTCEPRGHADLVGALLAEATDPSAHAGLLSFDATDWRSPSTVTPLAALRLDEGARLLMRRLGLRRIGEVMRQPRAPFAARFHADVVHSLRYAGYRSHKYRMGVWQ